jgi:hypothetical protein
MPGARQLLGIAVSGPILAQQSASACSFAHAGSSEPGARCPYVREIIATDVPQTPRGGETVETVFDHLDFVPALGDPMCNYLGFAFDEGRSGMPVLIRHRAPVTTAQYDEISPPLLEEIKKTPGFVLHVAFEDSQGFCVAEIWETKEQHDNYFNKNVVPKVPAEIKQEVINVHNFVTP